MPKQLEAALGLPIDYLARGVLVYRFTRLPQRSEYEYELTTEFSNGLAYNPAHGDQSYPPGHRVIHQWKIKLGIQIPVDTSNFVALKPGEVFPYEWLTSK